VRLILTALSIIGILHAFAAYALAADGNPSAEKPQAPQLSGAECMRLIQKSHIDANVPREEDFSAFLIRYLTSYFEPIHGKGLKIEYELLRALPTQSGVSYPKFYAWVTINRDGKVLDQGAVRLAAIRKERFEITHWLSKADIQHNPDSIKTIFPAALFPAIRSKAQLDLPQA